MRKILLSILVVVSFASCQYVDNTVETLKNNVRTSMEIPNVFPSLNLKEKKENNASNDSTVHFTLSNFIKEKFDL
ncbi:MAG: hypothetical protein DI598_17020 [Pseudopedobacter saltans]|uniref:Lipoprotein n=1 Tax=Pseudopedobacter saltans TaxID=151895 RepID=A0A2W5EH37_9SPHI|nr:MAG: hypothetical protein DI598_17020 [Pseudopedobacter saltans]